MKKKAERIGVFGGTFDPIHNAHVAMARAALEQAQLDRVLFVVSAHPPHKASGAYATPEQRFQMVEAALAPYAELEASRIEIDRPGPSYTVETLRSLRDKHAQALLFLILGMDSLVDVPKWKDHETILRFAQLLVVPRPGQWRIPRSLLNHYRLIAFPETSLSSSEIRARIASGLPIDDVVPEPVLPIIRQERVYSVCASDSSLG